MKIRLELVYPFFLECCKYSDDIFWKLRYSDHPFVEIDEEFWTDPAAM